MAFFCVQYYSSSVCLVIRSPITPSHRMSCHARQHLKVTTLQHSSEPRQSYHDGHSTCCPILQEGQVTARKPQETWHISACSKRGPIISCFRSKYHHKIRGGSPFSKSGSKSAFCRDETIKIAKRWRRPFLFVLESLLTVTHSLLTWPITSTHTWAQGLPAATKIL